MGKKVVLIDADIGLRNLDVVMGLENRIVYNLVDVIEGTCRLKQALIKDKRHARCNLMPAAQTRDKNCITPGQMVKLIAGLKEQFDYIILDCPAGIETRDFRNTIAGADHAIVVNNAGISNQRCRQNHTGLLEANEIKKVDLVVNRLRFRSGKTWRMMTVEDVIDILGLPFTGVVVPDDENVVIATNQGEPLVGKNSLCRTGIL